MLSLTNLTDRRQKVSMNTTLPLLVVHQPLLLSASDKKSLLWENNETRITIGAKHDKRYFYLAFSQEKEILTATTYCGSLKENIQKVRSWVATKEASQDPRIREQDKMCQGRFRVHVDVFTDYGQKAGSDFIINVGASWHDLDVEMCECQCIKLSRFRRFLKRISRKKQ